MKRNLIKISALLLSAFMLTGCGERQKSENEIKDLTNDGSIRTQTSQLGIPSNTKNFKECLESGRYYVVHDGVYYPLFKFGSNVEDAPNTTIDPNRQLYFTTENEINIPTLFEGDELVYYSEDGLLDYMIWERYYDLGYTVGLLNLKPLTNGRIYLDLSDEDVTSITPGSELTPILDLGVTQVLIDKIGGVQIDSSLVSDGLITSTKKSKVYDLEVYTGTHFQHYSAVANTHAFKAYELFASVEYDTMQEFLYKVKIPEYFVDGYYLLGGQGVVRIVRGDSYSEETDFNKQLLFPFVDENAWDYDPDKYIAPAQYSTFEPLNYFKTNQVGCLGYVSEDETDKKEQEELKPGEIILKEAEKKEIELYFPEGKQCSVTIKSTAHETTGDIRIVIDNSIKPLNYDRLSGVYETSFAGNGKKGTLIITGLTKTYEITLTNAEQYKGQDNIEENNTELTEDV